MKIFFLGISLLFILNSTGQKILHISSGLTYSKGKYGGDWANTFITKPEYSWAVNAAVEMPVSKKIILYNTIGFVNKKFTYSLPPNPNFTFERTENCGYLSLNTAIHYSILKQQGFTLTSGIGLFGSLALRGKYFEQNTGFGVQSESSNKIKFGKDSRDANTSYKNADAGLSLQLIGRYKNFIIPFIADFSLTNNIPSTDMVKRKWQSIYAGLGYTISLKRLKN